MDVPEFKLKLNFGTYYFLNQGYLLKIIVYLHIQTLHISYHASAWCNAYNSAKYLRSQNYFPTRKQIACAIKIPPYSMTHTSQNSFDKWTKISSLEIDIFDLKMMMKSGLDIFFNLVSPFRDTCHPARSIEPFWADCFAATLKGLAEF